MEPRISIDQYIRNSSAVTASLTVQSSAIEKIADALFSCVKSGGCIYSCGNGGSTCDAIHLTEELVARYLRERPGIRAQHLCDSATLTCWSNDYSFESVFSRQIETFVTKQDVLIAFSTSGNSKNIIRALEAANKLGASTIALLGKGGGAAKQLAKIALVVDSNVTSHVQEAHMTLVHLLCENLETRLYPNAK